MAIEVPRLSGKRLEPYGDKTIVGHCGCGSRWAGENLCHCSRCHLTFMSVSGFDRHRFGPIDAGRCRTPDDLRQIGMEPNDAGYWRRPMSDEDRDRRGIGHGREGEARPI